MPENGRSSSTASRRSSDTSQRARPSTARRCARGLANFRLRIAGELRVYYDVDEEARVVTIRGVGKKRAGRVLLGDKEIDLR